MRRLPILLVFALMFALLVLAPASADKPNCEADDTHPSCKTDDSTTTTTTTVPQGSDDCVFDENGVLEGWEPPESYRCRWTVTAAEKANPFQFSLELVTPVDGATVNLPHLIVTDVFPYGGDICFNEYVVGWSELPYSWSSFTLPLDGECENPGGGVLDTDGADVFAITIDVIKVKKGEIELTYSQ